MVAPQRRSVHGPSGPKPMAPRTLVLSQPRFLNSHHFQTPDRRWFVNVLVGRLPSRHRNPIPYAEQTRGNPTGRQASITTPFAPHSTPGTDGPRSRWHPSPLPFDGAPARWLHRGMTRRSARVLDGVGSRCRRPRPGRLRPWRRALACAVGNSSPVPAPACPGRRTTGRRPVLHRRGAGAHSSRGPAASAGTASILDAGAGGTHGTPADRGERSTAAPRVGPTNGRSVDAED
jgi:hypothetical protein